MFCWGNGPGGRRWQNFLSLPDQEYLEVQAGLAPTQLHSADISGGGIVDWVQAFTAFQAEPELAHQKEYQYAVTHVESRLTQSLDSALLQIALEQGRNRAGMTADILCMGSGWGLLESRLRGRDTPSGLSFPDTSIGFEEAPWAEFLRTGSLPQRSPDASPGSFVTGSAWEKQLEASPVCKGDWRRPYHLGVIAFENGNAEKAIAYWQESIMNVENPWAYRNMAQAAIRSGDSAGALQYYQKAAALSESLDISFAEEYIPLLLSTENEAGARAELDNCIKLAGSLKALSVPLLETAAKIALKDGDDELLDKIFLIEQAHIREGNTVMVDIWTEREIRRLCSTGMTMAEAEAQFRKSLANGSLLPPLEIDFRMYT